MKKFLRTHPDTLLVISGIILFLLLVGYFVWGFSTIVKSVGEATEAIVPQEGNIVFNIEEAQRLLEGRQSAGELESNEDGEEPDNLLNEEDAPEE